MKEIRTRFIVHGMGAVESVWKKPNTFSSDITLLEKYFYLYYDDKIWMEIKNAIAPLLSFQYGHVNPLWIAKRVFSFATVNLIKNVFKYQTNQSFKLNVEAKALITIFGIVTFYLRIIISLALLRLRTIGRHNRFSPLPFWSQPVTYEAPNYDMYLIEQYIKTSCKYLMLLPVFINYTFLSSTSPILSNVC